MLMLVLMVTATARRQLASLMALLVIGMAPACGDGDLAADVVSPFDGAEDAGPEVDGPRPDLSGIDLAPTEDSDLFDVIVAHDQGPPSDHGPLQDQGADLPSVQDTGPKVDAPSIPKRKITFALGSSTSSMTLATVNSDGTGYQPVPGFGALYLGYYNYLRGRVSEYYPVSRDIPQEEKHLPYAPIYLPRSLGYLKWFRDTTAATVGVMVIRPSGAVEVLYSIPGTSSTTLSNYFAASPDGDLVATHRPNLGVVLMRTNKTTFSNGKLFVELNIPSADYIYPYSLTLAGNYLFFISRVGSYTGQHTLWRAPVDGSKQPAAVTLPNVGGVAPAWIDDEIAVSDSGTAVITAGAYTTSSYSTQEDVIVIDGAGKATNITKAPGDYEERYYTWGYSGTGCQLTASPSGKYVAYVKKVSTYVSHLYVAQADGTGTPIQVTIPANISSTYIRVFSLRFIDDDNLVFTAYGSTSSKSELFRFQISTQTLSNLSQSGASTTPPFTLDGTMYVKGMWLSPNRKFLYYIHDSTVSGTYNADIKAVDLTTYKISNITKGAEVYMSYDGLAACTKSARMFFAAEPQATSGTALELFMFDMDKATPAVQLTNITSASTSSTSYLYDINPSPDCSYVAFRAGYSSSYDLYVAKVTPPIVLTNVTNASALGTNHYVYDYHMFAPDSSLVAFLSGPASNQYQLRAAPVKWPGSPQVVYQGTTGTYQYWQILGVE